MRSPLRRRALIDTRLSAGVFCFPSCELTMRGTLAGPLIALLFLTSGCDHNPMGTVDQRGNAPSVSAFSISPVGVRIDTIPAVNGLYPFNATVSARVVDADGAGDIGTVKAQALSPAGDIVAEADLHDDGVAPDVSAGDGLFTGTLHLNFARSDVGIYRIVYSASDRESLTGTSAIRSFSVIHRASPPWLYNLSAPDTVVVPSRETLNFRLSVAVGDSDGLADIRDVTLRVIGSSSSASVLHLLDNGSTSSADSVAGDGIYSIGLSVSDSSTIRKRYTLQFQAVDKAGDTSATLSHFLTIQ